MPTEAVVVMGGGWLGVGVGVSQVVVVVMTMPQILSLFKMMILRVVGVWRRRRRIVPLLLLLLPLVMMVSLLMEEKKRDVEGGDATAMDTDDGADDYVYVMSMEVVPILVKMVLTLQDDADDGLDRIDAAAALLLLLLLVVMMMTMIMRMRMAKTI